jgi:uncharacterized protein (DUF885 family)
MAALKALVLAAAVSGALCAAGASGPALAQGPAAAPAAVTPTPQLSAARRLADLSERFYEARSRFDPISATYMGDNRFDHLLPMTIVPGVRARQIAMLHDTRDELMRVDRSKLAAADTTTFDLLLYIVNDELRFAPFKDHLLPMTHMDSMPVMLANFGSGQGSQPLTTVAEFEAYHKRVAALPDWIDAAVANMRQGMREKIVLPRALVTSLLPQIQALAAATPAASAFNAASHMPSTFTAGEQARLKGIYFNTVAGEVLPALKRLAGFLEHDYYPAARDTAGWGALPDGAQWYRACAASSTTTSMSPDEIHGIGLAEVARINGELAKLAKRVGYSGKPAQLPGYLSAQAKYRPFSSEAQVLQSYRDLNARILPKLPQLFGSLPKAALEIRAEPPLSRATASDHYTRGADDGSRPGVFWAVIPDPAAYPTTAMASLLLHEGQPGHHFQLSRQQELDVPKFRKSALIGAYAEGWALYAETLGKELGLYDDPNAYAGHLRMEMLRAARLVVDTGLHAKGWTREQTIRYLVDESGETEARATNATERYMAWPGQALSYKVGALKIMQLRQRAAAALGPKFNLARFHDAVLAEGSLPLELLEVRIERWIAHAAQ